MYVLKSSTIFHRTSFSSLQSRQMMFRGIERLRKQISYFSVSYFSILLVKSCKCKNYRTLFSYEYYCWINNYDIEYPHYIPCLNQSKNSDIYTAHTYLRWLAIQTEVWMVFLSAQRRTPSQCFKIDYTWFLQYNFQFSQTPCNFPFHANIQGVPGGMCQTLGGCSLW
jgi:hypothetical protein